MGSLEAIAALLRRLRAEQGVVALLFVLVAVTSFAVTVGPRLFERVADVGLRDDVARATTIQRNVEFVTITRIPDGDEDPVGLVESRGRTLLGALPDSVRAIVGDGGYVVETNRFLLQEPPNYATIVTFRIQGGVDEQTTIVEGRRPQRLTPPGDPEAPPRIEVAISEATAAETLLRVGETYLASIDVSDPVLRTVFPRPVGAVEIAVVGILAIRDPGAPYWFDDTRLEQVVVGGTAERPIAFTTALIAPEAYRDVADSGLPASYRWRFPVQSSRLDAGQLEALVPDLRRVIGEFAAETGAGRVNLRTGLPTVIDHHLARRAATGAALTVAALGPLAVAAGALGIIATLVIRRRRAEIVLVRGRGASGRQLLGAQLVEGLLVAVPAAAVGGLGAIAAVPARPSILAWAGAALVAGAAVGLLVAATWPSAVRARRRLERDDPAVTRLDPRRLVFDALAIGLAITAAWLLRERGLGSPATGGERAAGAVGAAVGGDPFLALTPVLIGLAAGLLTIRLYPIPVRALGWLAARRRDLVPVLALRDIGRHPSASYLPLVVLTITVAIGSFASVVRTTIERGQVEASWGDVGADYAVVAVGGAQLARAVDPSGVPGVQAVARGHVMPTAQVPWTPIQQATARLLAVDPIAYAAVLGDAPVVADLPSVLALPPLGVEAGSPDAPIPALVSERLAGSRPSPEARLAAGDRFEVTVRDRQLTFEVVGIAAEFPAMAGRAEFVVAPYAWLEGIFGEAMFRPTVLFVRGGADLADELRSRAGEWSSTAQVVSRHESLAAMQEAPLVAGVASGFLISLVAAAAYAALTVVASVVLDAQRRAREVGLLRTLGATNGQVAGLTIVEHGLPTLVALAVGTALGLAVAWLLEPGLGLGAFIGPGAGVRLQVDPGSIAAVAGAVVAVVAVAVGASTWLARRLDLGRILRIGED